MPFSMNGVSSLPSQPVQADAQLEKVRGILGATGHASSDDQASQLIDQLAADTQQLMEICQQSGPEGIEILRTLRRAFVTALQRTTSGDLPRLWSLGLRRTFGLLMTSGLRDLLRTPEDAELAGAVRSKIESTLATAPDWVLPSLMLLERNFEHAIADSLDVPQWIRSDYLAFVLEPALVLNQIGDADKVFDHLSGLTEIVHAKVMGESTVDGAELCNAYVGRASIAQAYFTDRNVAHLYRQRGDLVSRALSSQGATTLRAINPHRPASGKIRLGIFAEHFFAQTETYFTLSHFEHLDRSQFDITLYCVKQRHSELETICARHADRVIVLPPGGPGIMARRMRDDDMDILLISTNMTANLNTAALLGSFRIAPIQIATVSSPVTTGCRHTDIMLSADWNEPTRNARDHFTEHLELLPGSINYYAFQHDVDQATLEPSRAGLGIDPEAIVMFSGANFYKITPELSDVWAEILAQVPNSVLMLMPFNPNWGSAYRRLPFTSRIRQQMRDRGIDPSRLLLVDTVPTRADVHRIVALADLYLDAHPFAGACSMLDPIIVGVPPVVWAGETGRSSHGASLMRMIGLEELICRTEDEYVTAAIEMAMNASRRDSVQKKLLGLAEHRPPVYLDTSVLSQRVGDALVKLHGQRQARYHAIADMSVPARSERLRSLAHSTAGSNFELDQLTDTGIIRILIDPFFRSLGAAASPRRVVDVGACVGEMSLPLIHRGWEADLFEPDPEARAVLVQKLDQVSARCRVHAIAVGKAPLEHVSFHKSTVGLSGFEASPFSATQSIIDVPCTTLAAFCAEHGVANIDFLKIDAEGYDFEVLESHDFESVATRLVLVEYGTHFPRQTLDVVNSAVNKMAARGYSAVVFNYQEDGDFRQGDWRYRLTEIFVDEPIPDMGRTTFGNILFYRNDDTEFAVTVFALLDTCRRPRDVWAE